MQVDTQQVARVVEESVRGGCKCSAVLHLWAWRATWHAAFCDEREVNILYGAPSRSAATSNAAGVQVLRKAEGEKRGAPAVGVVTTTKPSRRVKLHFHETRAGVAANVVRQCRV